jgi:CRP/FNR family transcriptional regulator, anaerobic regulatory protein
MNDTLTLLQEHLQPTRRLVREGDNLYSIGQRFDRLSIVRAGSVKLVDLSAEGHERVSGLRLRGDWLGFDGMASGVHACDAVALDVGEVWSFSYESLTEVCVNCPTLLQALNKAMSEAIAQQHRRKSALCSLSADGRVADYLRRSADDLARRGLRSDRIDLRLSRAEIGQQLGLTLESVSRAFSRLARERLIHFPDRGRREVAISDMQALAGFVQRHEMGALQ